MKSLKWEGIGTKNLFPHTSSREMPRPRIVISRGGIWTAHNAAPLKLRPYGDKSVYYYFTPGSIDPRG